MHKKIDVLILKPDFFVFSGHKMLSPTGVGVLYINKNLHNAIEPYLFGGSMVKKVTFKNTTYTNSPAKFEAGTPPISSVIGLGVAVDYIKKNIDFQKLQKHEASLCSILLDELEKICSITIVGNKKLISKQGHLVSFNVKNVHAHDIADFLGKNGVAIRAGHHCAQPLVNYLGFDSLLRVSFLFYNTKDDVQKFVKELKKAISFFSSLY